MPTTKLDDCSYEHKYFWKKHKDQVLQKFLTSSDDLKKLGLDVERVDKDSYNRDWEHRCEYCKACRPKDDSLCKRCQ